MGEVQARLHIPRQSTRYIGRNSEVRNVLARFESHTRLVTLTGTGGIGKTRLALEIGTLAYPRFPAGVFLSELGRTSDPQAVPSLVAATLGIPLHSDRILSRSVQETVHQPLLLILDNCEHLIDAVASLAQDLVANTAWVFLLATSRESLSVPGEQLLPLSPMTVPSDTLSDIGALLSTESVQLFVDRAQLHHPDFRLTAHNAPAIRNICRRLDGIPLAIELAAAHVRVLSPREILARLNNRFSLLKGIYRGLPPRQHTLTALFDWSYDLLTEPEQLLWQRLSIFAPGFSLDAVHHVVTDKHLPQDAVLDTLTRLVNKSIVTGFTEHGATRYHMLETIREYGRAKLAQTDQFEVFRGRHKDYYANQVRQLVDKMFHSPTERLTDIDNVTEAFSYALDRGDSANALIISAVLSFYAHDKGMLNIYRYESLKRAIETVDVNDMSRERAFALVAFGYLARALNKVDESVRLLQQALHIAHQCGDGFVLQSSLTHLAQALPHTESRQKIDALHGLLDAADHWVSITSAQSMLSQHYLWKGETSMALRHATLCVKAAQGYQGTFYNGIAIGTWGTAELVAGSPQKALNALEAAVNLMNDINHVIGLCDFLLPLARTYQSLGQREQAVLALEKALRLQVDMDLNHYVNDKSIAWIAWTFVICADLHLNDTIRSGTHIIIDEMKWQPKHLRDRCATIVRQASDEDIPTDSHILSRKQWVQLVLSDLEAGQFTVEAASDTAANSHGLTARELDILRALSQGLSNKAIANKLYISESTVRTYLSNAYGKLGVSSRTEALIQVRKLGLVDS